MRDRRCFTIAIVAVGVLLTIYNAALLVTSPETNWSRFGVIAFLFACIAITPGVKVRHGNIYYTYQFWEYPVITGLALGGPPFAVALLLTTAFGAMAVITSLASPNRRAQIPAFLGVGTICGTVGVNVAAAYPPYSYPVGYFLIAVLGEVGLFAYALNQGRDYAITSFREDLAKRLAVPLLSSVVVTVMVASIGPQREFLVIASVSVFLFYWLVQWRMSASEEQAAWRHMESISSKFIGELEEYKAITVGLEESLRLFSARRAEIVLPGSDSTPGTRWSLSTEPGSGVEVSVLSAADAPTTPPDPTRNSQVLPLSVGEQHIGYMVVEWDPMSPEKRTRKNLINTFGNAVAASIAHTRHNRHISNQAAEKAREAERDPLTGLGNRSMLSERGPALLKEASEVGRSCALLLFDLDGFKRINDTLGHAAGDQVIIEVARRIKETVRRTDLAIRLGGDEFAVLAIDLEFPADAERLANKITAALIPPITVEELQLSIESSIGVAIYPNDAEDVEALLKCADIAMYQAKDLGRGKTIRYSPSINFHTTESLSLVTDLRQAIVSADELVLHYQPQVDLRSNRIAGMEALVRWNHPTLGLLYPDRFVSIAERSNLVRQFTLTIIEKALIDRQQFKKVLPGATTSVNLSAQNLLDTGLTLDVEKLLDKYHTDPRELVLEVTETTTAKDAIAANRVLSDLAALGCPIAMDDFGSGYSTLDALRRSESPIVEIKIDRGFIQHIATSPRDFRVASAIVEIAHAWDCWVVAEGVEDERTYNLLRQMDCDLAQGYWLQRPAPLETILEWVRVQCPDGILQMDLTDSETGEGTPHPIA